MPDQPYVIYIDDNFHYMDESERYKLGEFSDCQSAVAACKQIVDEYLASCGNKSTAKELFSSYCAFGEDPWISSSDQSCIFSARKYAEQRCNEIASKTTSG